MREPRELPDALSTRAFDRAEAERAGVSQGRLRRRDIRRPFHGVQIVRSTRTVRERCNAYSVRLKPGQAFSHPTALLLQDLPLPRAFEEELDIHVAATFPAPAPSTRGVAGHRLRNAPPVIDLDGLVVVRADEAWAQMAGHLTVDELIELGDAIVWRDPTLLPLLREAAAAPHRTGAERLRRALQEVRAGSRSPGETRVRLLLTRAGLPRPMLNARIELPGGAVHPDLVWPDRRVVLEYEGDGHREQKQFRYDVSRDEALQAAGWTVVRVTADDVTGAAGERLVARMRALLLG